MKTNTKKIVIISLVIIWIINCVLGAIIAITTVWIPHMNAAGKNYNNIKADAFDGTAMPIAYIPNWLKSSLQDKQLRFSDIPISDLIPIPKYNVDALANPKNIIDRFTYTVLYMGSYTLNYKENDGSHLGVDIRAPIGTPVLSIANGVVVRAVEADAAGNKFVVIRHENVPVNGKITDLYSGYLHLSEITAKEGTKIRKGEMLGRVGQTGMASTPHLHFQIDTADAPFHPYWPYTGAEARAQWLGFLQAVTAGLGAEKWFKYTINPLIFVQHYLSGDTEKNHDFIDRTPETPVRLKTLEEITHFIEPEVESAPVIRDLEELVEFNETNDEKIIVASQTTYNSSLCDNLQKVSGSEDFIKNIFQVSGQSCAFDYLENISEQSLLTREEALIILMKFYKENPSNGISPFVDISLANSRLQGYAQRAFEKRIFSLPHLFPKKNLTRGEFVEIIGRFWHLNNAQGVEYYTDIPKDSALYNNIQNFAATIQTKHKHFSPNTLITQGEAADILSKLLR